MKIDMHLFCSIVALATTSTDGRISSSASSQPEGGSVVDMTPNRRDLQPALDDSNLIRGGLTSSNKDANSYPRSLALSDCNDSEENLYKDKTCDWLSAINNKKKMKNKCNKTTKLGMIYDLCPSTCSGVDLGPCTTSKLEETIESLLEEKTTVEEQLSSFVEAPVDCTVITAEMDDLKAQVTTVIAEKVVLEDRVTAVNKEKDDLMVRVDKLVEAERLFIEKQISLDTNTMMVIKALGVEKDAITAEKDNLEIENDSLRDQVAVLEASLANTDAPSTAPSTSAATDVDYAYSDFYNNIKTRPIQDERAETYCSSVWTLEIRKNGLLGEIGRIEADIELIESEQDYLAQFQGEGPDTDPYSGNCRCEALPGGSYGSSLPSWKQVCSESCAGTNYCLNLDFVCSPSVSVCVLSCTGRNSCKGVTMYCADNQVCAITSCGDGRCVGAKVVYNGMEYGVEQEWQSPPASRYFRFN